MKGKILCPTGCQNPISRITKAKENLKSSRSAGSWRPFKCIFGERKKDRAQRAESPVPFALLSREPQIGAVCGLLRARFYRGAKIRLPLIFAPTGILLGSAFPKPCYGGLRRKNIPDRRKVFSHFRPGNG